MEQLMKSIEKLNIEKEEKEKEIELVREQKESIEREYFTLLNDKDDIEAKIEQALEEKKKVKASQELIDNFKITGDSYTDALTKASLFCVKDREHAFSPIRVLEDKVIAADGYTAIKSHLDVPIEKQNKRISWDMKSEEDMSDSDKGDIQVKQIMENVFHYADSMPVEIVKTTKSDIYNSKSGELTLEKVKVKEANGAEYYRLAYNGSELALSPIFLDRALTVFGDDEEIDIILPKKALGPLTIKGKTDHVAVLPIRLQE